MKRSEVNAALKWAMSLLDKTGIHLPDMAHWTMDEWARNRNRMDTVSRLMLGWDITDFGTGVFDNTGAVLYTVRNGSAEDPSLGVPYCEKLILMKNGQHLPQHYHVFKTEDIICRAGGPLEVKLWNADPSGNGVQKTDVRVFMDGFPYVFKAGEPILVTEGNSISLTPYLAHIFGPAGNAGDTVIGEVSKVNDDRTDNYFLEPTARFADIEEDEQAIVPLCNEYERL